MPAPLSQTEPGDCLKFCGETFASSRPGTDRVRCDCADELTPDHSNDWATALSADGGPAPTLEASQGALPPSAEAPA